MKTTLILLIAALSSCVAVRNPLEGQQFISSRNYRAVDGGNIINEEYVIISFDKGSITFNYQDSIDNITLNTQFHPSISRHPFFTIKGTDHSIMVNLKKGTLDADSTANMQIITYRQFYNLKNIKR